MHNSGLRYRSLLRHQDLFVTYHDTYLISMFLKATKSQWSTFSTEKKREKEEVIIHNPAKYTYQRHRLSITFQHAVVSTKTGRNFQHNYIKTIISTFTLQVESQTLLVQRLTF